MKHIINVKPRTLLQMDANALADFLRSEVDFHIPEEIHDGTAALREVYKEMAKATAYICYFKEMETLAKIEKRNTKTKGCNKEMADNVLSCEELFSAYKRIAEQVYEQLSKYLTVKRLELEEEKVLGRSQT